MTDFAWWDKQKQQRNFMISVLKENSAATFVESIPFVQNAIMTGRTLIDIMDSLTRHLKPRGKGNSGTLMT